MTDFVKILVVAITILCIDFIYLNLVKDYFSNQIKLVQGKPFKMNYIATFLSYMFLIFGMYHFIIKPKSSVQDAFLLGIVIYGVFETTNMALFSDWSWLTVFIDTLWGGVLFASSAYIVGSVA
jgi:uncharacterized membrane protein